MLLLIQLLLKCNTPNSIELFNNMKIKINNYKPSNNKLLLDNLDVNIINKPELLIKKIINEQIGTINCIKFNLFKKVSLHILYIFPKIKINIFISDLNKVDYFYLNYATCVYAYDLQIKKQLLNLTYIKKPTIKLTKLITFGTFDLLHIGHKNIFDKCNKLSSNIVVGVSSDELNTKKNKKAYDSITTRINNVKKYSKSKIVFKEESLEQKLEYIKSYDCNVLVMGNDWDNKFNSTEYESIYFKRTPNISSTLLRNEINKINY